jgi:pilus assembly protein CpaE
MMQQLTFITLNGDPESSREIRDALNANERSRLLGECNSPDRMLADVVRLRPSAAVVVLNPENSEDGFSLIGQLASACPDTAIICSARDASPDLILGCIRSGAREFLQLPIHSGEFQTILNRVEEFSAASAAKRSGRTVAVFSAKGGAGASFFATNLAAAMSVPTVLTDLNLQAGDSASFLGLEPKYSLADFVHNRSRLDDSLIASLITPHAGHLSLVAAPFEAHEAEDIKPDDITEILHLLSQRFQCVVMDLPHTFDPMTVAALDLADDVLVVMTLDIPGIRNTRRALKVFERLGYPRGKIRVVVNRWSKNIDVELKKVEVHLDEQLIGFVPNDYAKVMNSINMGRPLVQSDPASKVTLEIKRIAALVENHNHGASPPPRRRLLGSMFLRHKATGPLELSAASEIP